MYYVLNLSKELEMHPREFGKHLKEKIETKLISEVEGTCSGKYGYVIAVTAVLSTGKGIIRKDASGLATFKAEYQCIACRPFKGEVMDSLVVSVNKMGFFATAGPLNIFVSNHLIPEEYEFDSYNNYYTSPVDMSAIKVGSHVRVRIVGIKVDPTEIFCIATMKDDFLGVIGSEN